MWIKDTISGKVRPYGTDSHDALRISEDGKHLSYENLQNGDGSEGGGYLFTDRDGRIPNECKELKAYGGFVYFDQGGDYQNEGELYNRFTELMEEHLKLMERIKRAFERAEKDIEADYSTEDYYSALSKKDTLAIFGEELKG